jgi:hypothetical protein
MPYCRDCGSILSSYQEIYCSSCQSSILERSKARLEKANHDERRRIDNDLGYAHDWLQSLIGWIPLLKKFISFIVDAFRKGCFITTAVVSFCGIDDHGSEMTAFRWFRDTYLCDKNSIKYKEMQDDLEQYYSDGYLLIRWIDSRADRNEILEYVCKYVFTFLDLINRRMLDEAYVYYKNSTCNLKNDILLMKHFVHTVNK